MKKNYLALILLTTFSLVITGCSVLSPVKVSPVTRYILTYNGGAKPSTHTSHKTLFVATPIAAPGYQTDHMMYVKRPFELKSFSNHEWVAPPAKMLLPLLVQQLRSTRQFHAVVSSPFTGTTDFRLEVQLIKLQQSFITKPSRIQLQLQAQLIESATHRIIADRDFKIELPAYSDDPAGGAYAANEATARLLTQIGSFVVHHSKWVAR